MSTISFTEHAVLMCHLAEYQDRLDEEVDAATIDYLHKQESAKSALERLRSAIDRRDTMKAARGIVGGAK